MITKTQFDRLPKCFQDKIELDNLFSEFKKEKILDFIGGRRLSNLRLNARYKCQAFIRKSYSNNNAA